MPRVSRKISASGCYHVIIRGVNRQEIFLDDRDREKFLDAVARFAGELEIALIAYCLMDNHVHLLMNAGERAGLFVKKLASSYVFYFNRKYERVGHLFQDRFRSEAVDTEAYLLTVARYILQNPAKAGLCGAAEYAWSSWQEAATGEGLCDTSLLCRIVGDRRRLMAFLRAPAEDCCLEADGRGPVNDQTAGRLLCAIAGLAHPQALAGLGREAQRAAVARARREGLSIRQIARLTGLNRNVIQRM